MIGRHRDLGPDSPMTMRWIDGEGNLMRTQGDSLTREDLGLPPKTVETGRYGHSDPNMAQPKTRPNPLFLREEDLREAPLGSQDKARKMVRRAAEKYRNDCQ